MKELLVLIISTTTFYSSAQNHRENFRTVNTLEEANAYASGFHEVSVELRHPETDHFFFDEIDTSKADGQIGTYVEDFFGRTIKLIQDTTIHLVNVQVITFDMEKVSKESAEILRNQMQKRLDAGDRYWDIKEKFKHTSAEYHSGPVQIEKMHSSYGIAESQLVVGNRYLWNSDKGNGKMGIVIIEKRPHTVRGMITISCPDPKTNYR